jgi:hypothetical protein
MTQTPGRSDHLRVLATPEESVSLTETLRATVRATVPVVVRAGRALAAATFPEGGQGRARRNAWAGVCAGQASSRDRLEAERALAEAAARGGVPASSTR